MSDPIAKVNIQITKTTYFLEKSVTPLQNSLRKPQDKDIKTEIINMFKDFKEAKNQCSSEDHENTNS